MKALCIVFSIILLLHFMASTLTFQWISIYSITTIIYSFYNCFWILVRFNFWYFLSIKRPAYEINIQLSSQIYIVSLELGGGFKQPKKCSVWLQEEINLIDLWGSTVAKIALNSAEVSSPSEQLTISTEKGKSCWATQAEIFRRNLRMEKKTSNNLPVLEKSQKE